MNMLILKLTLAALLVSIRGGECRKTKVSEEHSSSIEYNAISCRAHSATLTDFGGVGDGKTSNTKAFHDAINHLSHFQNDGGAQLFVPPGRWLTGSFNLTSHFTLYLHRDAVLLASQDISSWSVIKPLPSYGRGRDTKGGRFISLIFGTNLTDVIITGENGTIDGQGEIWWQKFHKGKLKYTRPYLIELMFSNSIQISNITLVNSPSWNVHPVYSRRFGKPVPLLGGKYTHNSEADCIEALNCSNILIQGITIIAPVKSPNTDGINQDSCSNTRIEDCYIISGDDCVAVKSGWDEYGIAFGMPTQHLIIRRLTCVSPYSATIALGSEMSGGIQDVRAEDITAINTESGVRIKTAKGRGAYVRDIYVRRMSMQTMKWAFWMTGNYGSHPDNKYDPNALPKIHGINYRDIVAENVQMAGRLEGISGDTFTGICMSNVTISMGVKGRKKMPWSCSDIEGSTSRVSPPPCDALHNQAQGHDIKECDYPKDRLPIDDIRLKRCSYNMI